MESLQNILPKDKHDLESIAELGRIGFPALNSLIPELLTWTQDINWPVAAPMCLLLSKAGQEIIPEIESILQGDDLEWSYFVITSLLPKFSRQKKKALIPTVKAFMDRAEETHYQEIALEFLDVYKRNS